MFCFSFFLLPFVISHATKHSQSHHFNVISFYMTFILTQITVAVSQYPVIWKIKIPQIAFSFRRLANQFVNAGSEISSFISRQSVPKGIWSENGRSYVHVNLQLAGLTVSGRPREKKCQQQYLEWKHLKYISLMADPPLISFSQSSGSCFHSIVWAGSHH